jgi:hypothetical protein
MTQQEFIQLMIYMIIGFSILIGIMYLVMALYYLYEKWWYKKNKFNFIKRLDRGEVLDKNNIF